MKNPTSKDDLLQRLQETDSDLAKKALCRIFSHFSNPAFGALPKRELEIVMFQALQDMKIFDETPDLYSLLSSLRITRSKARNLLYESNLRKNIDLSFELRATLSNPIVYSDNNKFCLEIGNPLLIDHLKHKLKELNHITDGSFSPDLVKLTPEAYKALLNISFPKIQPDVLKKAFINSGLKKELTVKTLLSGVLKKLGEHAADKAGSQMGESIGDFLGDVIEGSLKEATAFVEKHFAPHYSLIGRTCDKKNNIKVE